MRKAFLNALIAAALCMGVAEAEVIVKIAPPRLRVEHRPRAPGRDYVWIGGYHRWDGRAYAWEPGRWEAPPHAHAVWIAPRWEHRHDGYVFVEGRWK